MDKIIKIDDQGRLDISQWTAALNLKPGDAIEVHVEDDNLIIARADN